MNWLNLISDIKKHGLTQPQIAAICGCGQATISDLENGKTVDPRHSLGEALVGLLQKLTAESSNADKPLDELMADAAQAGLIERRKTVSVSTPLAV